MREKQKEFCGNLSLFCLEKKLAKDLASGNMTNMWYVFRTYLCCQFEKMLACIGTDISKYCQIYWQIWTNSVANMTEYCIPVQYIGDETEHWRCARNLGNKS